MGSVTLPLRQALSSAGEFDLSAVSCGGDHAGGACLRLSCGCSLLLPICATPTDSTLAAPRRPARLPMLVEI